MGFSLLKRPVYYQQVKTEPPCSCDKYCDVNELELMRKINDFTCTYYNLQRDNLDLIKAGKNEVKKIQEYFTDNIINNRPAPTCCGDYCNKDELQFFKNINQHYQTYFDLKENEKEKILEGAEKLKDIYQYLENKFNIKPCGITSIALIKDLMRKGIQNDGTLDDKLKVKFQMLVMKAGFYFDDEKDKNKHTDNNNNNNNENIPTVEYNGKIYELDCD
jgi:hypothetical protein